MASNTTSLWQKTEFEKAFLFVLFGSGVEVIHPFAFFTVHFQKRQKVKKRVKNKARGVYKSDSYWLYEHPF